MILKHKLFIDGKWQEGTARMDVRSPWSGDAVATTEQASAQQIEAALAAAARDFHLFARTSRYARSRLCAAIAAGLGARRADIVESLISEAGKPRMLSDIEVTRAIGTFTIASEEAKRTAGESIPVDLDAGGRAFAPAISQLFPKGVVLAITPFNFPLNLVAHKVAPALAVGAPVLLKPPPQAPGAATILAEIFEKAAREVSDTRDMIPLSALQIVNGANDVVGAAVADPRVAVLSFTGSDKVGWMLQGKAIGKKLALELGGNAAAIIHSDADLARAAQRAAFAAYAYAGQVCISLQRLFVEKSVEPRFRELLLQEIAKIQVGDPAKTEVVAGPLIDAKAADRVMSWIDESVKGGAKLLCGGKREKNTITPTLLSGVKATDHLACDEVFGPVLTIESYEKFDEALSKVNSSRFGLQAGLFTDSQKLVQRAFEELEVGGLVVNEMPIFRADHLPYGGVKESGLGREGLRYAIEDYCERRVLISWRG